MAKTIMAWLELNITTSADYAENLCTQMTLLGACAITFQDAGDQPIYEPQPGDLEFWQETIVVGLFTEETFSAGTLDFFEEQQATGLIKKFNLTHLADQEWERVCLANFQPLQFGQRLWVCPSWLTPPDPHAVNVILDPGLAFGTGSHATTGLCLTWLEKNIHGGEVAIDYGCGSGILSIAALKLGAKQLISIDHDPQALVATQNNAQTNQLSAPVLTTALPHEIDLTLHKVDLLIANILALPLIQLAEHFALYLKEGGKIVLSGILCEQLAGIQAAYNAWFTLDEVYNKDNWLCLAGRRK
jgi:ribosomal protein L11 methyltransferase